jgi:hypothetical protein
VIQLDRNNRQAIDILAKLSAVVSPENEVRWRQRLVELQPGSSDALFDLAQAAIDATEVQTGLDALRKVPATSQPVRWLDAKGLLDQVKASPGKVTEQPGATGIRMIICELRTSPAPSKN